MSSHTHTSSGGVGDDENNRRRLVHRRNNERSARQPGSVPRSSSSSPAKPLNRAVPMNSSSRSGADDQRCRSNAREDGSGGKGESDDAVLTRRALRAAEAAAGGQGESAAAALMRRALRAAEAAAGPVPFASSFKARDAGPSSFGFEAAVAGPSSSGCGPAAAGPRSSGSRAVVAGPSSSDFWATVVGQSLSGFRDARPSPPAMREQHGRSDGRTRCTLCRRWFFDITGHRRTCKLYYCPVVGCSFSHPILAHVTRHKRIHKPKSHANGNAGAAAGRNQL
ncbi:hypothetical protein FGB62_167g015 [Gracilaria domingensis]|nr:hypothetical protein FGB62_167g015 [Gracilaria domingensis]